VNDYFDRFELELRDAVVRVHGPVLLGARRRRGGSRLGAAFAVAAAVIALVIGGGAVALLHGRAGRGAGRGAAHGEVGAGVPAGAARLVRDYPVLGRPQRSADRVSLAGAVGMLDRADRSIGVSFTAVDGLTRVVAGGRVVLFVLDGRSDGFDRLAPAFRGLRGDTLWLLYRGRSTESAPFPVTPLQVIPEHPIPLGAAEVIHGLLVAAVPGHARSLVIHVAAHPQPNASGNVPTRAERLPVRDNVVVAPLEVPPPGYLSVFVDPRTGRIVNLTVFGGTWEPYVGAGRGGRRSG
jgi:hypothetical protein